jgi:hypothetical protein
MSFIHEDLTTFLETYEIKYLCLWIFLNHKWNNFFFFFLLKFKSFTSSSESGDTEKWFHTTANWFVLKGVLLEG